MAETMNAPSDNIYVADLPDDIDEARLGAVFGAYGTIKSSRLLPGPGRCGALIQYTTQEEAAWVVENLNGNIAQGLDFPIKVNFARPPVGESKGERFSPYGGGGKGCCGGKAPAAWDRNSWEQGSFDTPAATTWGSKGGGAGKGGGVGGPWANGEVPSWAAGWDFMMKPRQSYRDNNAGKGKFLPPQTAAGFKKSLVTTGILPGGKMGRDENALYIGGLPSDTTDKDLYEIFACFGAIVISGVHALTNEDGSCRGIGFVNYQDNAAAQFAIASLNGTQLPDGNRLKVAIKLPRAQQPAQMGMANPP